MSNVSPDNMIGKWCPFARVITYADPDEVLARVASVLKPIASVNRQLDEGADPDCGCLMDGCAVWVGGEFSGRCGLVHPSVDG